MRIRQLLGQALLVLAILLLAHPATAANDKGLFWHAEKDGRSIYLLGSVHLATADFYPLRAQIQQAYEESSALLVEADIIAAESDIKLQQQIMAESFYGPDRSLRDDLSPELLARLEKWLRSRNVPEALFMRQRPAIAMITLSMVEVQARGLDPSHGIDRHFLQQAHRGGKPIMELEGVLPQLRMLNSIEKPELLLEQTLEQLQSLDTLVPKLLSTWKAGDAQQFYQLIIGDGLENQPEYESLYETMFFKRNREMSDRLARESKKQPALFAIVGAGHLVGKRSVVDYLRQQGFTLRQL